jgi:hypothetical protein
MATVPTGYRQRHRRSCTGGKGCGCPWEATVGSGRTGKVRRTFPIMVDGVAATQDALSDVPKTAQLLDIQMDELAGRGVLIPIRRWPGLPHSGACYRPEQARLQTSSRRDSRKDRRPTALREFVVGRRGR